MVAALVVGVSEGVGVKVEPVILTVRNADEDTLVTPLAVPVNVMVIGPYEPGAVVALAATRMTKLAVLLAPILTELCWVMVRPLPEGVGILAVNVLLSAVLFVIVKEKVVPLPGARETVPLGGSMATSAAALTRTEGRCMVSSEIKKTASRASPA